jgi:hypothetical protein
MKFPNLVLESHSIIVAMPFHLGAYVGLVLILHS